MEMNSVNIIGRMTRDAEIKTFGTGSVVANVSIAVNRFSGTPDNPKKEAYFFDVSVWGKMGESLARNMKKGCMIGISGELRQERWEKDGQKRQKIVVVANRVQFLTWPKDAATAGQSDEFPTDDSEQVPF